VLAGTDEPTETEDILYMVDGRILHGQIISENADEVVFELVVESIGLRSRLTYRMSEISKIERDVPQQAQAEADATKPKAPRAKAEEDEKPTKRYGKTYTEEEKLALPTIYVVPMRGQMGTDIAKDLYEEVIEDIKQVRPDVIVFELNSKNFPDLMVPQVQDPRDSFGFLDIEGYRELVNNFHDQLSDIRQVVWVKDSVGLSSLLALSWPELYMTPEARLAGLRNVIDATGADKWSDPDVRAKMSAAWSAFVKAFLEYGGYSAELADAMLWPEVVLYASFMGREVVWSHDGGEFIVDDDDEKTVGFRAKVAEDLLISDGTVENLDDLAFLLGYREYNEVGGHGQEIVNDYIADWHKLFNQTKVWYQDYQQHMGWATGADTIRYLGKAKSELEKIIRAMERYEAVEHRWQRDLGISKFQLETQVEQMKEQLQALKSGRGANIGGRGGGGGMGRR
jgi:hypothetical protein